MTHLEIYNLIISPMVKIEDIKQLPGVKFIKMMRQYEKDNDLDNLKNWCINQDNSI